MLWLYARGSRARLGASGHQACECKGVPKASNGETMVGRPTRSGAAGVDRRRHRKLVVVALIDHRCFFYRMCHSSHPCAHVSRHAADSLTHLPSRSYLGIILIDAPTSKCGREKRMPVGRVSCLGWLCPAPCIAGAPERDGVALLSAQRRKLARYPELARGGPHRLCVLAAEIGGRWNDDSQHLVQHLVALRAHRAPARLRGAASQGWARRWWGVLAVAAQHAACSAVLGIWTMPPLPNADSELPLAEVLHLAAGSAPSRLTLR